MEVRPPKGDQTRPTSSKVRAAVFNSLAVIVQDSECLDLFAGSGALGFEAISRGARSVLFNDFAASAHEILKLHVVEAQGRLRKQGLVSPNIELWKREADQAIAELVAKNLHFDIIFCDPPYQWGQTWIPAALNNMALLLREGGRLVIETDEIGSVATTLAAEASQLEVVRNRRYRDTILLTLCYNQAATKD